MVELRDDLRLALDRSAFARALGVHPDPWQEDLLGSSSDRVLLNCSRQSGKSTMAAIIALHRALYHPGSLILCLAPALRQSQELFGKLAKPGQEKRDEHENGRTQHGVASDECLQNLNTRQEKRVIGCANNQHYTQRLANDFVPRACQPQWHRSLAVAARLQHFGGVLL